MLKRSAFSAVANTVRRIISRRLPALISWYFSSVKCGKSGNWAGSSLAISNSSVAPRMVQALASASMLSSPSRASRRIAMRRAAGRMASPGSWMVSPCTSRRMPTSWSVAMSVQRASVATALMFIRIGLSALLAGMAALTNWQPDRSPSR